MSSDALVQEIVLAVISLVISLFHLEQLQTCFLPVHIWVIGEWIGIFVTIVLIVSASTRYEVGSVVAGIFGLIFAIWNVSGAVIIISSLIATPQCMPYGVARGLGAFSFLLILLVILGVWAVCTQGTSIFNTQFVNPRQNAQRLQDIEAGNINAVELVANNRGLDNHSLLPDEKEKLLQYCSSVYYASQRRPGEDTSCAVCMDELTEGAKVLNFPTCGHIFHENCIMEWLIRRTTCPMCRQGIRSGLYQKIQATNEIARRNVQRVDDNPTNQPALEHAPLMDANDRPQPQQYPRYY